MVFRFQVDCKSPCKLCTNSIIINCYNYNHPELFLELIYDVNIHIFFIYLSLSSPPSPPHPPLILSSLLFFLFSLIFFYFFFILFIFYSLFFYLFIYSVAESDDLNLTWTRTAKAVPRQFFS